MLYGLYLSAQGAEAQLNRLDVIANNLANASTSAFKRDLAVFQSLRPFDVEHGMADDLPGDLNKHSGGVSLAGVVTDFSDGPILPTGGTFDVALSGPGFLHVSNGRQEFLTRNGKLMLNEGGDLVTQEMGYNVLDPDGVSIRIDANAKNIEIAADGAIYQIDELGGRIKLTNLALVRPRSLDELQKVGSSFYRATGNVVPAGPEVQVRQGHIEASGTRPILEMTELIQASRAFETNLNMIKYHDEALGRLLQSVTR